MSLYVEAEVLTGEKFLGTFGWGGRSVLQHVAGRLRDGSPVAADAQRTLAKLGGLEVAMVGMFLASLRGWPRPGDPSPGNSSEGRSYGYSRRRLARKVRSWQVPRATLPSLEEVLDRLTWLVTPHDRHVTNFVAHELTRTLPAARSLETVAPWRSPGEAATACLLSFAQPVQPRHLRLAERYLNVLPTPMLAQCATQVSALVGADAVDTPTRRSLVSTTLDGLTFLSADPGALAE